MALLVALLCWPINTHADPIDESERPLVLAIHPYLNAQELIKRFTPLADYLSEAISRDVVVRVGRTYEEHIHQIGIDLVDIAYMGPAPYVLMVKDYGLKPLLVKLQLNGSYKYTGLIITRKDSDI